MDTTLNVAYGPQIAAAATRHNLDPRLLAAVAAQETGGPGSNSGRNVVGDGGHGHGLFQIDDRWHPFAGTAAAMDPAANADYAAGILQSNLQHYGGNVHEALSAYNTGSPTATGTPTTWGDGTTLGYADSVLRHYAELGGSGGSVGSAGTASAAGSGSAGGTNAAASTASGVNPYASGSPINALQGLLQLLGGGSFFGSGAGAGSAASSASAAAGSPSIGMPQLPQYKPLQQPDGRERDVAPSELLSSDDE